jgi:polyene glycosyltransferase
MRDAAKPILFVSLPEAGLINSMLVLAGELARRGVPDLWYATDEPQRARIEATPELAFASLGEVIPEMSAQNWEDEVYREVTAKSRFRAHHAVMKHAFRPGLWLEKYRKLEAWVDKVNPALMVVDCEARFAISLAIARGIPYVLTVPFMPTYILASHAPFARSYVPRSFPVPLTGLPYSMTFRQRVINRLFKLWSVATLFDPSIGKALREDLAIHKSIGLPPPGQLTRVDKAALVLCGTVLELEYPFEVPDRFHLVGAILPPLPEAPAGELAAWLDAHASVVYLGLGTITRLTRAQVASLVEVARRLGDAHQVLWKLPESRHHLLPESLPGNLRVESWVPSQLDVLAHPHVTAFVTHGGGNGFNEGLYFGKPMVTRPLWADNHDVAVRGEDKGVSLTLDDPHAIEPDDVTDKLTRVLNDPEFRRRAELFSALQRNAGGRRTSADLILALPALAGLPGPEKAV